jgi:hypothetical protein
MCLMYYLLVARLHAETNDGRMKTTLHKFGEDVCRITHESLGILEITTYGLSSPAGPSNWSASTIRKLMAFKLYCLSVSTNVLERPYDMKLTNTI